MDSAAISGEISEDSGEGGGGARLARDLQARGFRGDSAPVFRGFRGDSAGFRGIPRPCSGIPRRLALFASTVSGARSVPAHATET